MSASTSRRAAVPALVDRAMSRLDGDLNRALALPYATCAEQAERAARLAVLFARCERWWRVLGSAGVHGTAGLPEIAGKAAIEAAAHARSNARFWQESAAYWTARAEGLSDREADRRVAEVARSGWVR